MAGRCAGLARLSDPSYGGGVIPPHVDGVRPRRAAQPTTGPAPRPDAAAIARARALSDQFVAQIQQSMMDSLAQLDDEPAEDGEDAGEGGEVSDFGDLGALSGAQGLGSTQLAKAGAADEATLARQMLAAYAALEAPGAVAVGGGASGVVTKLNAPITVSGPTDVRGNAAVVASVAREHRVDPVVAVAMMLVESGGNARAVGDGGTSFGLFQLHKGGMLTAAGLTPNQAFDARTNARVSLRSLAHEWSKGSRVRSPGEIAAASQRPADPVGYARKVDAAMAQARSLLGVARA